MTAVSKAWQVILDGQVDPGSPLDTVLLTAIRDALVNLDERLGGGTFTRTTTNHTHDGTDSASIRIGPNLIRNGSFEDGTAGWTFTDYTGGSHAISTSTRHHGAQSSSITSTVLANGGGDAISNEFIPCGTQRMSFQVWRSASVANVSSKAEVTFYDNTQALISTSTIYTETNTPTSGTLARVFLTAPANARFCKIKLTGGIPASGTATGTIFFDGVNVTDWSPEDASIAQAQLKTSSGDVSTNSATAVTFTLPGGAYGFYPQLFDDGGDNGSVGLGLGSVFGGSPGTAISIKSGLGGATAFARQRYIQSSPPYDLGDGEVPLFMFAAVDAGGNVVSTYAAEDPPWANNGPTSIRPDFTDAAGRAWQRRYRIHPESLEVALELVEVDQALKQADMALIPHPFARLGAGLTPVLINPVGTLALKMRELQRAGANVSRLLHDGIVVGNKPLSCCAPPGVMAVAADWKLTR